MNASSVEGAFVISNPYELYSVKSINPFPSHFLPGLSHLLKNAFPMI